MRLRDGNSGVCPGMGGPSRLVHGLYGGDDEGRHYRGLLVRSDGRSCGPHIRHGKYGKHRFEQVEGATSGGRFDRGRDESGI